MPPPPTCKIHKGRVAHIHVELSTLYSSRTHCTMFGNYQAICS